MADKDQQQGPVVQGPLNGLVPAIGTVPLIRIPFPGKGNLVLSFRPPPGWKGGSTTSVFIMEKGSKFNGLRLDFGQNKGSNKIDYHWNIQGRAARDAFPGITNHMPAGPLGKFTHTGITAFRYVSKTFLVVGLAVDAISIAEASNPLRRSSQVVSAWTAMWLGSETLGAAGAEVGAEGGAAIGTIVPGAGTAAGAAVGAVVLGLGGAIYGGYKGYQLGEKAGGEVYDWAQDTFFTPLPKVPVPQDAFEVQ